jgi:hypothetical protein
LIEQLFPPDTAQLICSIPISPHSLPDSRIWIGTRNGIFSVRSAYHLELDRRSRVQACSSVPLAHSSAWQTIWNLDIPRAIQVFLWRACSNILPTKAKLFRRRIVEYPLSPLCGKEEEDSGHVL